MPKRESKSQKRDPREGRESKCLEDKREIGVEKEILDDKDDKSIY